MWLNYAGTSSFRKRIFENFANGNRLCSRKNVLPVDPNFEKDQTNDVENLIIHDRLIPNPFSLKTVNNFNSPPPFGLLVYHRFTDYD